MLLTACDNGTIAENIVKNIYNGQSAKILTWARGILIQKNRQFTATDVKAIEQEIFSRKAIRNAAAKARDEDIDAYRLAQRHGIDYAAEEDLI